MFLKFFKLHKSQILPNRAKHHIYFLLGGGLFMELDAKDLLNVGGTWQLMGGVSFQGWGSRCDALLNDGVVVKYFS